MESSDITIIFLTPNKVPKKWALFHKEKLIEAAGSSPIITISMEPLDWGINILQNAPYEISNIYAQLLKGAKLAATRYIGVAEDDALYPREHFICFRPPMDSFAYNMNRLGIFTWGKPTYFWNNRVVNATLIAPRELTIEALEERFRKYPKGMPALIAGELGKEKVDRLFGVSVRKQVQFFSETSVIRIDHEFGLDQAARKHTKRMGAIKAYDIPYWGKAEEMVKKFV